MLPGPFIVQTNAPTKSPTVKPTAMEPTNDPTLTPSVHPSVSPSVNPSKSPSEMPSVGPSLFPTENPSKIPSTHPTINPTLYPTLPPTVSPSLVPTTTRTEAPSAVLTVRPTSAADADSALIVNVEQDVLGIDKDDYDAQQAACNFTIQHTVADAVIGVTPERVTDIIVEEEEEEEGGRSSLRSGGVVASAISLDRPVRLKYTITVYDPLYTVATLRAELAQAVQEGRMDTSLRFYAAQFGATGLNNATLAVPQVTNAAVQRGSSSQLTGVMIALLVISVFMALGLAVVGLWWGRVLFMPPQAKPSSVVP